MISMVSMVVYLILSFLFGIGCGALLIWILFKDRFMTVRRARYLSKLRNLQETARLEKEGY